MKTLDKLLKKNLSQEDYKSTKEYSAKRVFSKQLYAMRVKAGLSQAQMAKKVGCGQPKISKIEEKEDALITMEDLRNYCQALDYNIEVHFHRRKTLADHVAYHVHALRELFSQLIGLCKGDKSMTKGTATLMAGTADGLLTNILTQFKELGLNKKIKKDEVEIEVEDEVSVGA